MWNKLFSKITSCFLLTILFSCKQQDHAENQRTLFSAVLPDSSGIHFRNDIEENEYVNPMVYQYSYNGGGVAVGDVNGDGLDDVYFTGNEQDNRLYLNKGHFKFEDITNRAGVQGHKGWKTGVTMADVNGDGRLDIYVCYSGNLGGIERRNELFINHGLQKGIPVFKQEAEQFGLADSAFSTQAAFFDFDKDGDLDMVLLNHSPRKFSTTDDATLKKLMNTPDSLTGVKLFRNDKNVFKSITRQAGLHNTRLSYGLGVSVADINSDGWPDIYISNDFIAPDYLYINNRNGTFDDHLNEMLSQTSEFSMGNDIADINNDGLPDIMTTDMLPEDNRRQKLLFSDDNYELFDLRERNGLHAQYMRNMLHINNGDNTFSEVAQLAGVSNTDWSWAPLFADFDNDGWKDLFVSNGFVHDYTNLDFEKYQSDYVQKKQGRISRSDLLEMVKHMPSSELVNYIFKNNGDLSFTNVTTAWGIKKPSNSNGAAYADLDNDGDLDLIVNNINDFAAVYRNDACALLKNNYLTIELKGEGGNQFGVGAKVLLYKAGKVQYQENLMQRGFQSSVSPVLHFGLGNDTFVDSIHIIWPMAKEQWVGKQASNQRVLFEERNGSPIYKKVIKGKPLFQRMISPVTFDHREDIVNDFKRQPLLVNALSYDGPCMAKADVNGDGREDLFIGGGAGQVAKIFLQEAGGRFEPRLQPALLADAQSEDVAAVFFDADNDGDVDLYVCSGGYDGFTVNDTLLQDRLYFNDGKGLFSKKKGALPQMYTSTSCVTVCDINHDGALDLFVGGRVVPGRYPEAAFSYILLNDGGGNFSDATQEVAPGLVKPGMITDAAFVDINGDTQPDLVTAGEWMPIQIWISDHGKLVDKTEAYFGKPVYGWWNKLLIQDINGDGKFDIIAGNNGTNTQCKATFRYPAQLIYKDFDDNGAVDPILCFYIQGKSYPYVSRDELLDQLSMMRIRFVDYKSYSNAQFTDVFSKEELANANTLLATSLETSCFLSSTHDTFCKSPLPPQAQFSPVHALTFMDVNNDGKNDLILAGNVSHARIKMGKNVANRGVVCLGDGKGAFTYVPQFVCGLALNGDVRAMIQLRSVLLFGMNNQGVEAYKCVVK